MWVQRYKKGLMQRQPNQNIFSLGDYFSVK
jgi:hypothetical protein